MPGLCLGYPVRGRVVEEGVRRGSGGYQKGSGGGQEGVSFFFFFSGVQHLTPHNSRPPTKAGGGQEGVRRGSGGGQEGFCRTFVRGLCVPGVGGLEERKQIAVPHWDHASNLKRANGMADTENILFGWPIGCQTIIIYSTCGQWDGRQREYPLWVANRMPDNENIRYM
jgi:hypothetical protein